MNGVLKELTRAAAARQRVALFDGRTGVLVYAPSGKPSNRKKPPRHGDSTQCGVRLDGHHRDRITAVPIVDIAGVLVDEPS